MLLETVFTIILVASWLAASKAVTRILESVGRKKEAAPQRAVYIAKIFNAGMALLTLILLSLVWGVDYGSVFVLASSVLAVLGVAFFAQWSILSNITASIVIFFSYPARIGDLIRVVDGDNSLEGEIVDIALFQVLIKDINGDLINYPNNLIIQKPLIKIRELRAPPTEETAPEKGTV